MLNFTDVTLRRGPRVLFSGATFGLFRGEKVGITGENGSGKSSLLALVRGELHPDAGTFEMPSNLAIAQVSQELIPTEQAAIEFVLDGDPELRAIEAAIAGAEARNEGLKLGELHARYAGVGGYGARSRAGTLMHGLGFTTADESRPVRSFSGGWRVRLNVAQALMCRSDLLLLDEPTNHLDLDAILWLESWLREYPGTLLLIAHDREFLDRIVNRIVNIEHGKARTYRGNYSAFEDQRAAELAEQSALYARQQREIRHMESFVERFRAKATKARQAQSRLKALERMQRIAPAHVDSPFEFSFAPPLKLPRPLLALENQSAGYDGRAILEGISVTLAPEARLAILGRNGAGKSTYMKLLAGELTALAGTRTEARDLRIGYFAQHQLEQLQAQDSPLGNLRRVGAELAARATEQELRDFLAGFGFRGDRVFEPVAPFSGGEKARLVLALTAYLRPNLLLLDEPTNHLDLEMRQALAVALQD
jgi:ATP-binding cassette, subfamily F, member 3